MNERAKQVAVLAERLIATGTLSPADLLTVSAWHVTAVAGIARMTEVVRGWHVVLGAGETAPDRIM